MASFGTPLGLLLVLTREVTHTFDTSDTSVVSENFSSENIIFSPNVPQYKPVGMLKIEDSIERNGLSYRIGGE